MAGASSLFFAVCDGSELFLRVEPRRGLRPIDEHALRLRARVGRTLRNPGRGGNRLPIGGDSGEPQAERRKRHLAVDIEGFPIKIATHEASVLDRDRAPAVTLGVLKKASHVKKIWADGGYRGRKPEKEFCSGSDFGPLCRYWDKLLG